MSQKTVVNTTLEEVTAFFDGQTIYFKPGAKKSMAEGPADEIVRENTGLVFEEDVVKAPEVEKEPEDKIAEVVEADKIEKPKKK